MSGLGGFRLDWESKRSSRVWAIRDSVEAGGSLGGSGLLAEGECAAQLPSFTLPCDGCWLIPLWLALCCGGHLGVLLC